MTTQAEQQNYNQNQNSDMRPTNSHVNGPGALGSEPAYGGIQSRFDNSNANAQGGDFSAPSQQQQQHLQENLPPPTHPDRTDQGAAYGQGQGPSATGASVGQGQYDSSTTHDQNQYGNQPHTLDRRGHRGPGAKNRAAEAGAVYEGEKLTHGGQNTGRHDDQYEHDTTTGPNQNETYANQGPGVTGTTGHHAGGGPVRAMEAGATYEGGKLANQTEGHPLGRGHHDTRNTTNADGFGRGTGPTGTTTTAPNVGQTGGPTVPHHGIGTAVGTGGAAGTTHPGAQQGTGRGTGAYNQQPVGANTAGPNTGLAGPGTRTTGTSSSSGQPNVILGKIQQAGGTLLGNESMKAKGLEREAKGVAKTDQREAERLEGMAGARRDKAGGILGGTGPASATAGVDPTVGAHGRNF